MDTIIEMSEFTKVMGPLSKKGTVNKITCLCTYDMRCIIIHNRDWSENQDEGLPKPQLSSLD